MLLNLPYRLSLTELLSLFPPLYLPQKILLRPTGRFSGSIARKRRSVLSENSHKNQSLLPRRAMILFSDAAS
jgi:hypothetical protein